MAYRENLAKARKAKGLTQKEAARLIGVSEFTWRAWELGVRTPSLQNAQKVAELLEQPIEVLFPA